MENYSHIDWDRLNDDVIDTFIKNYDESYRALRKQEKKHSDQQKNDKVERKKNKKNKKEKQASPD